MMGLVLSQDSRVSSGYPKVEESPAHETSTAALSRKGSWDSQEMSQHPHGNLASKAAMLPDAQQDQLQRVNCFQHTP